MIDIADVEFLSLIRTEAQQVAIVYSSKLRLALVHHVVALAKVEVHNINRVYLFDILIVLPSVDIVGDKLRGPEEHSLEIGKLWLALHFNQYQFPLPVFSQKVYTVILGLIAFLVAFTLQKAVYLHVELQQRCEEALKHAKIGLVAQDTLQCPVETDKSSFFHILPQNIWRKIKQKSRKRKTFG